MKIIIYILLFLPLIAKATNYTWSNNNGNIAITKANYPTLTGGDTVFIPPPNGTGYISQVIQKISGSWNNYITIYWMTGAHFVLNQGSGTTNLIDSCNYVHIYRQQQKYNQNVGFQLGTSGHNHHIWIDSCNFKSSNGLGLNYTGALPAWNHDTVNCEYAWRISYCIFDSLIGNHDGGSTFTLGTLQTYGVWLSTEIDHNIFSNYSSATVAANFFSMFYVFGYNVHDNYFANLGENGPFAGHARQIFSQSSGAGDIYNNHFFNSFGEEWIMFGECYISDMLVYNRRSTFHDNIVDHKKKYPIIEFRANYSDTALIHVVGLRTNPKIFNITAYRLGLGVGNSPYNVSILDFFGDGSLTDTLFVKNCVMSGPLTDSTCGVSGPGYSNSLITLANGPVGFWDTASNRSPCTFALSGFQDSIKYTPIFKSILYNAGVSVPSIKDYYGNPVPVLGRIPFALNTGIDIGAIQLYLPGISIPYGAKIKAN